MWRCTLEQGPPRRGNVKFAITARMVKLTVYTIRQRKGCRKVETLRLSRTLPHNITNVVDDFNLQDGYDYTSSPISPSTTIDTTENNSGRKELLQATERDLERQFHRHCQQSLSGTCMRQRIIEISNAQPHCARSPQPVQRTGAHEQEGYL